MPKHESGNYNSPLHNRPEHLAEWGKDDLDALLLLKLNPENAVALEWQEMETLLHLWRIARQERGMTRGDELLTPEHREVLGME